MADPVAPAPAAAVARVAEAAPRQPLLHDAEVVLRAPVQVWSRPDGGIGEGAIDGAYIGDTRLLRGLELLVEGVRGEHLATLHDAPDSARFVAIHRDLDGQGADPDVRGELRRTVLGDVVEHELVIASRAPEPRDVEVAVLLTPDASAMNEVKAGLAPARTPRARVEGSAAVWEAGAARARLDAPGARLALDDDRVVARWRVGLPARGAVAVGFRLELRDEAAVVVRSSAPVPWAAPDPAVLAVADDRLRRWVARALGDLDALRLETTAAPGLPFLAAGAPWFFTLFGRDSLWAARLLLPLGTSLPLSTVRLLAAFQGVVDDVEAAEEPGKILHELRSGELELLDEGVRLAPEYYGTVDATPLWVQALVEIWRAGVPAAELADLRPALEAALAWMRDHGDSDGDGLLEYVDRSGHGLSNQGWKDSGDSVQWGDGRLAAAPLALCEVQGYAYAAAVGGADLLDALGGDGAPWRRWAERLARRFREAFWVSDAEGAYPAVALDADKRPVDSLTSNIGHLLGTGLLDERERALVAARLVSPRLSSGYGLRTLDRDAAGYWPLSYHGGSVWAHDTAIAIRGLAADGFAREAAILAEGLLAAAAAFDSRIPELHSGDAADEVPAPEPYPAACRPQAWSAAAAIAVLEALTASS